MKKTLLALIAFTCLIIISASFTTHEPPGFKNLKILPKDISEKDLDSVMHHFSMSLGVRCNFCHVRNDEKKEWNWASDDKPEKLIARKMMLMADGINKKYFHDEENTDKTKQMIQTVTCYTCHHGEAMPLSFAPRRPENKKDSTSRNSNK